MFAWLVDQERFVKENEIHVIPFPTKKINWMVDPITGYIELYIVAAHSNEIFCYIHKESIDTLDPNLGMAIDKTSMVLGTRNMVPEPIPQPVISSTPMFGTTEKRWTKYD